MDCPWSTIPCNATELAVIVMHHLLVHPASPFVQVPRSQFHQSRPSREMPDPTVSRVLAIGCTQVAPDPATSSMISGKSGTLRISRSFAGVWIRLESLISIDWSDSSGRIGLLARMRVTGISTAGGCNFAARYALRMESWPRPPDRPETVFPKIACAYPSRYGCATRPPRTYLPLQSSLCATRPAVDSRDH